MTPWAPDVEKKDYVGTWTGGDQLLVITPSSVKNKDGSFTLSGDLEVFRGNERDRADAAVATVRRCGFCGPQRHGHDPNNLAALESAGLMKSRFSAST